MNVGVDHVVVPLDRDHVVVVDELSRAAADAAGVARPEDRQPHVTLAAYAGLGQAAAQRAIATVVADVAPFAVHAHGYGFFAGDDDRRLNLHVPVVRDPRLDDLHERVVGALIHAGARIAGWTEAGTWTPHITLIDGGLDPPALGRAVTWLASHHHPSWQLPVDCVAVTGGWEQRAAGFVPIRLSATPLSSPPSHRVGAARLHRAEGPYRAAPRIDLGL